MNPSSLLERLSRLIFLWLGLAFLTGIVAASAWSLSLNHWLAPVGVALLLGLLTVLVARKNANRFFAFLPLFFFLGAAYYQYRLPVITEASLAYYNDTPRLAWVTGALIEPPDVRDSYQNLRVKVSAIDFGDGEIKVSGYALLRVRAKDILGYGDIVRVRGVIRTPPEGEDFSYREYLAREGIHSILYVTRATKLPGQETTPWQAVIYRLKAQYQALIYRIYPDPEASLLNGILLGNDNNLPPDLQTAFKNTGTSHIIAISGFNIAIVAAVFLSLFSRLTNKILGAILAVLAIAFYTVLVGADPSVVRAAIMGTISILAQQLGRRNFGLNTLMLVAVIMAIFNPLTLWDVGFQLSFAATLGLMLYADPLQRAALAILQRILPASAAQNIIHPLSDYILLTFAAQITTLPVIIYHFGRVSFISFLANPFILPFQPPIMTLGGLSVLMGALYEPLGKALAFITLPFPAYTIRAVEFFNGFGGVWDLGEFSLLAVVAIYILLFTLTLTDRPRRALAPLLTPGIFLAVLFVFTFQFLRTNMTQPDTRLHITLFDVGSGDAIFIQTPQGGTALINGGPSASRLADQLGRRLPTFGRKLDFLVIASTRENQIAALPGLMERYAPATTLWTGRQTASISAPLLDAALTQQGLPIIQATGGEKLDLGDGAFLQLIYVGPRGAIALVEWGDFRAIFPLGIDFDTFETLQAGRAIGPVNVLLLADTGYAASNPPEWIANLSPQALLLSVAADDPDGLPDPALLKQLDGYTLLRTDLHGWIEISTDGKSMWIETQKQP